MPPLLLLTIYGLVIIGASLLGGWLPSRIRLTHIRLQILMSLVSGVVLGVALLHLLPHAAAELPSLDWAVGWALAGLLITFFLVRFFHSHSHAEIEEPEAAGSDHDHDHEHGHSDHAPKHEGHAHEHDQGRHTVISTGLAVGLGLHSLMDGIALGAYVAADARQGSTWALAGFGAFLAVALHKPLDSMSIISVMAAGGWPPARRHLVNGLFALICPLGAALFWFGSSAFASEQHLILGCALAFSAGVFLCISLGDLLPEVQFHRHDRVKLSAALLLGVALAYGIRFLEPAHAHGKPAVHEHHAGEDRHE